MPRQHLTVLIALSIAAPWALAQDGLRIDDLTARPRLHEYGGQYTIEVRFTTPIPAVASVSYGEDASCPLALAAEAEPFRNHRFDIPDVRGDQRRFVRVTVAADDHEVASDVIEVAPPEPFPRGNVERGGGPFGAALFDGRGHDAAHANAIATHHHRFTLPRFIGIERIQGNTIFCS